MMRTNYVKGHERLGSAMLKRADYLIILAMIGVALAATASLIFPLPFRNVDPNSISQPGNNPNAFIFFVIFLPLLIAFIIVIYMAIKELKADLEYRMRAT